MTKQDIKVAVISLVASLTLAGIMAGVGVSMRKSRTPKPYNVTVHFADVQPDNTPAMIALRIKFDDVDKQVRFDLTHNETISRSSPFVGSFSTIQEIETIRNTTLMLEGFTQPSVPFSAQLARVTIVPEYLADEGEEAAQIAAQTLHLCPQEGDAKIVKNGWRLLISCPK